MYKTYIIIAIFLSIYHFDKIFKFYFSKKYFQFYINLRIDFTYSKKSKYINFLAKYHMNIIVIDCIFFTSYIYKTTLAQSKRKTVKLTYKLYIKFHVKYKIQCVEKIKLEKVKVKTYAAADSSCRIRSMTGPRSPL